VCVCVYVSVFVYFITHPHTQHTLVYVYVCYMFTQLCGEDYNWWWRSFITSGACAVYVFVYSIYYFFNNLEIILFVSGE